MRHTAVWWTERVAELAATGDACAIARRHGVKEGTLKWWRTELRKRAREGASPRLLPVVVKPSPPPTATGDLEVFIEVGATCMTLRGAVSPEYVAAIVTASARAC